MAKSKNLLIFLDESDKHSSLNLSHQNITYADCSALVEELEANNSLQKLNLAYSNIDSLGAFLLANALKNNYSLQTSFFNLHSIKNPQIKQYLERNFYIDNITKTINIVDALNHIALFKAHKSIEEVVLGYLPLAQQQVFSKIKTLRPYIPKNFLQAIVPEHAEEEKQEVQNIGGDATSPYADDLD